MRKNAHTAFLSRSLGVLGITYAVYLRLTRKPVVDFLLVIIELFSLGVKADEIQVNINWKSPFFGGHFGPTFQVEGDVPTNHLCTVRYGQ